MKEHKVVIRLLMEHTKLHQMMSRLQRAYEGFGNDEQLLREVENVLHMYR